MSERERIEVCEICGGTGEADSGAPKPYGGWYTVPCECVSTPQPRDWKPGEKVLVEAVLGSMMHTMTPDKDRQRKRSETPRGSAQAVFQANHQAMLAMAS